MIPKKLLKDTLNINGETKTTIEQTGKGRFELTGEGLKATINTTPLLTEVNIHAANETRFNGLYKAILDAVRMVCECTGKEEIIIFYSNELARKNTPTIQKMFEPAPQGEYMLEVDTTQPIYRRPALQQ